MRDVAIAFIGAVVGLCGTVNADVTTPAAAETYPNLLAVVEEPESVYPPLRPARPEEGINQGGVDLSLTVSYLTDYVYRGIDFSEVGAIQPSDVGSGSEDAPNLQFDGKLSFDLGRWPHPFVGVFVNVFDDDPVSRFQEIRPYVGFDWDIKPIKVSAGQTTYIYPERDEFNTAEVFLRIELDDSGLFGTRSRVLSPYVFAAYDYDRYEGLYIEAGVRHDFPIEDTGIVITALADVAYVQSHEFFTRLEEEDTGFQHYDIGLIGSYSLNNLINVSRRYGEWTLKGYLFYTDGIDSELRADTQLWGGVGIQFEY